METLLTILHVIVSLFLIGIVLLQHGKGADIGATFGGSSQSLFGSEGPLPLLNKITTASAIIFMLTSVSLAYISSHGSTNSVMSSLIKEQPVQTGKAPVKKSEETTAPAKVAETPPVAAPAVKAVDETAKDKKQ